MYYMLKKLKTLCLCCHVYLLMLFMLFRVLIIWCRTLYLLQNEEQTKKHFVQRQYLKFSWFFFFLWRIRMISIRVEVWRWIFCVAELILSTFWLSENICILSHQTNKKTIMYVKTTSEEGMHLRSFSHCSFRLCEFSVFNNLDFDSSILIARN